MKKIGFLIIAICLAGCVGKNNSQASKQAPSAPSNLPPEGYILNIWVDDRGCSYLKTTQGNTSRWVPKVSINGNHLCGSVQQYQVAEGISDPHQAFRASPPASTGAVSDAVPTQQLVTPNSPDKAIKEVKPASEPTIQSPNVIGWVRIGLYENSENVENIIQQLSEAGLQYRTVKTGRLTAIHVAPRSGQFLTQLRDQMRAMGYPDALILMN